MAESSKDSGDATQNISTQLIPDKEEENNLSEDVASTSNDCHITKEDNGDCSEDQSQEDNFKSPSAFAVPTPLSLSLSSSSSQKKSKSRDQDGNEDSCDDISEKNKNTKSVSHDKSQKSQASSANYKEPEWGGEADEEFWFDVLKNGTIINNIPLKDQSHFVFGRLPSCDFTLEHPSLSRYHAVIQYSKVSTPTHEKGWYVYDLDSTHGTWVNKRKINAKVYHRIKVGYVVKFGGSSRLHILQGPPEDGDEESEMSVTEMKELREKQKREAELLYLNEKQEEEKRAEKERLLLEDKGCAWGIGDDAEDVEDENQFASLAPENENLYIDDPKKALKGFYEREGLDLPDYQFGESSAGSHKCTLEIPIDGPNGEELMVEAVVSGKKKESVVACALEACRLLDKLGMLRSSTHERRKRKERNWEDNDYYDSDEDTFLDRTGAIEKKRNMRMKKAGKETAETYESLMTKYTKVTERIQEIETKLEKAKADADALANEELDELDAYMVSIKSGFMDSKTRLQLKGELLRLRMDEKSLHRLVNIAKPASLPPIQPFTSRTTVEKMSSSEKLSNKLQNIHQQKTKKMPLPIKQSVIEMKSDEYEEDDSDEEMEDSKKNGKDKKDSSYRGMIDSQPKISESQKSSIKSKDKKDRSPDKTSQEDEPVTKRHHQASSSAQGDKEEKPKPKKKPQYFSTSAALETMDKNQHISPASQPQAQVDLDTLDPKFATWIPPSEQTGDGRTSLNDKFGY